MFVSKNSRLYDGNNFSKDPQRTPHESCITYNMDLPNSEGQMYKTFSIVNAIVEASGNCLLSTANVFTDFHACTIWREQSRFPYCVDFVYTCKYNLNMRHWNDLFPHYHCQESTDCSACLSSCLGWNGIESVCLLCRQNTGLIGSSLV